MTEDVIEHKRKKESRIHGEKEKVIEPNQKMDEQGKVEKIQMIDVEKEKGFGPNQKRKRIKGMDEQGKVEEIRKSKRPRKKLIIVKLLSFILMREQQILAKRQNTRKYLKRMTQRDGPKWEEHSKIQMPWMEPPQTRKHKERKQRRKDAKQCVTL